ncbi:MAG TPA: hypothetical protein VJ521_11015, partial [Acidobacteriota bacterium]|nr:hypothetical protein [Acidobacteriota bacterium]
MTAFARVLMNAVGAVVLILLIGCRQEQPKKTEAPAPMVKPFSYSSPVLEVSGSQMREAYRSAYRLKPDRRFLTAVAEIRHLITREPRKSVEARFSGDHWTILHAGEQLGQVSEFPDYSEFKPLLSTWASRLIKSSNFRLSNDNPPATTSIESFLTPESIPDLRKIDQTWNEGKLTSDSMRQASRHLIHLMLQHLDRLEMADVLAARSLAMIVLTESLSGAPLTREECLLAHAMGYTRYASDVAEHLDKKDTVRLFIAQQDTELKEQAMSDKADQETRYLFLLRVAAKRDTPAWSRFVDVLFPDDSDSLGVVKTGIEVKRFELAGLSRVIQPLVFRDITKIAPTQVIDLKMLAKSNQAARTQK